MTIKELQNELKRLQERRSYAIKNADDWNKTKESIDDDIKLVYEKIQALKGE